MQLAHVVVHSTTRIIILECGHANPAYMGLAIYACHMVAPFALLDVYVTFWTGLGAILFTPSTKCIHPPF